MLTLNDYLLLESRPPIFLLSPTVSFSFKASTEQLGRGSCGPGVGPGRLLKYLIFRAWTMTNKKLSQVEFPLYHLESEMEKIVRGVPALLWSYTMD